MFLEGSSQLQQLSLEATLNLVLRARSPRVPRQTLFGSNAREHCEAHRLNNGLERHVRSKPDPPALDRTRDGCLAPTLFVANNVACLASPPMASLEASDCAPGSVPIASVLERTGQLIHQHPRGHRQIEAFDPLGHGDGDKLVDGASGLRSKTLPLGPETQDPAICGIALAAG